MDGDVCIAKAINHMGIIHENEIEITEEHYNQLKEFPLKLTIDENGKVVVWEKTEFQQTEQPPIIKLPTLEERISAMEEALLFITLGGTL